MNTIELLFALLAVAAFTSFSLAAEKNVMNGWVGVATKLSDKYGATECAALANQYFANAGGRLNRGMECKIENGNAFFGKGKSATIPAAVDYGKGNMLIEAEIHYGN